MSRLPRHVSSVTWLEARLTCLAAHLLRLIVRLQCLAAKVKRLIVSVRQGIFNRKKSALLTKSCLECF